MSILNTHFGGQCIAALLEGKRQLFFIGIGGIHMASLALAAKKQGFCVSGSDSVSSTRLQQLRQNGITVHVGHEAAHIAGADAVIYTLAISEENSEYLAARALGIPLISRADFLSFLTLRFPRRVAVAGSHGKSTVTAMLSEILTDAGRDPCVFSGAVLPRFDSAVLLGGGGDSVVEACEYRESFLCLSPTVAVLLNTDFDHPDYFEGKERIDAAFAAFAALSGENGTLLYHIEDEGACAAARSSPSRKYSFGLARGDCHARGLTYTEGCGHFRLCLMGKICGEVTLRVAGEHNVKNALAAALCAALCEVSIPLILQTLSAFRGAARRMEYRGLFGGARFYDDYAHHPAEIAATLCTARQLTEGTGRVLAVFQSHTYSRTAALFEDFCRALRAADRVFVTDIYPARETDTLGMSGALLAKRIGERGVYVGDIAATARALCEELATGDTVVVMGAGDIDRIFAEISPNHFTL